MRRNIRGSRRFSGGAPVSAAVDPNALPTLGSVTAVEQWIASKNVTIATGVSAWVGNIAGYTLSQGTGTKQPTQTATDAGYNNKATITFDGSNDGLVYAGSVAPAPSTGFSFAWVGHKPTGTGGYLIGQYYATAYVYAAPNGTTVFQVDAGAGSTSSASTADQGTKHFWVMTQTTGSNSTKVYRDGSLLYTLNPTVTGSGAGSRFELGAAANATALFSSYKIAELVVYSGVMSSGDVSTLYSSYFSSKYSV